MSRPMFIVGLIVSVLCHGWLVLGADWQRVLPDNERLAQAAPPIAAEVVKMVKSALGAEPTRQAPPAEVPDESSNDAAAASNPVPMTRMRRPAQARNESGDFSGEQSNHPQPVLRIDWGTAEQAREVLRRGQMKLVVLRKDQRFNEELICQSGQWRVRRFQPQLGVTYSNSLRVVDGVAAFRQAATAADLRDGRRLAVLVPTEVERVVLASQEAAASREGIQQRGIRTFGGRFTARAGGLGFEVTRIQRRGSKS